MIRIRQFLDGGAPQPFDLSDRGLLLADGVLDTSLVVNGEMFLQSAHLDRLIRDADALDIDIGREEIEAFVKETLGQDTTGALRLTVTRGPGERGLTGKALGAPTLIAALAPLDKTRQFAPLSLQTSAITRNPASITAVHKTLAYTDNIVAVRRAQAAGFDEALFLNTSGQVACAATGNVFIREGKALVTPPIADGVLPGIMRGWLLENAPASGFAVAEDRFAPDRVSAADQVFVTNSLRLIAPVSRANTIWCKPVFCNRETRCRRVLQQPASHDTR
ncbi:MAG: aminotransferase class IV, partial [Pseudomonadota bacterium]